MAIEHRVETKCLRLFKMFDLFFYQPEYLMKHLTIKKNDKKSKQ